MKSIFKAAFYLRSNHVNKDGKSMVMLRCSLNGERANFGSTGIGVDPKAWDCTKSRVNGRNTEALSTNLQLSNLEDLVTSIYYKYAKTDMLSLERIKQDYLGKTVSTDTIMELFETHNEDIKKQVGCGGLSTTSYSKYELVRKRFAEMIMNTLTRSRSRKSTTLPRTHFLTAILLKLNFVPSWRVWAMNVRMITRSPLFTSIVMVRSLEPSVPSSSCSMA